MSSIVLRDHPKKVEARTRRQAAQTRRGGMQADIGGASFGSLSRGQKDQLLEELLTRAGLLDDDGKVTL